MNQIAVDLDQTDDLEDRISQIENLFGEGRRDFLFDLPKALIE